MTSNYTRHCRAWLWFYRILDAVCLGVPLLVYVIIALSGGALVAAKVAVVSTVMIALILTVFNVIAQKHLRCPIWIIIIGLYIAIGEWLLPLIIILAITSVLDDLVFTPLIAHYKMKLEASKVYDDRMTTSNE